MNYLFQTYFKSILFIFLFILSFLSVANAQFTEVYRQDRGIIYPQDFFVFEDDEAILFEPQSDRGVLTKIDLENGEVLSSVRSGRGPGEVARSGSKILSKLNNDEIWLWDSGLRRGTIFDESLSYIKDIKGMDGISNLAPLNTESVLTWTNFGNQLFEIKPLLEDADNSGVQTFLYEDFEEFESLRKTPLARQGISVSHGNSIYQGYWYSSYIVKINEDGIEYITGGDQGIGFPEYESSGGVIEAPDHSKFPEATKSMAVNDDYLFVLHSGRKFDEGRLRTLYYQISGRWEELNQEYEHTDRLLVYDAETGEFLEELQLPEVAHKIQVTHQFLYAYSFFDEPVIVKYRMELDGLL